MNTPPIIPSGFAHSLTLAVIASSDAMLVLLDSDLHMLAVSDSFCAAFAVERDSILGSKFSAMGHGEWARPQLNSLLTATVSGLAAVDGYELDLQRSGMPARTLMLNAHLIDHAGDDGALVMLAVTDVTEVRAATRHAEDLTRDKAMLVQEMQHRVANSLQIIASVLMQSARKVNSEETRGHLQAAHNRVMSVASVQRQLAGSGTEDVTLRPYLDQLCLSLAASMIHDARQLKLLVVCDATVVPAAESISLGLVVTELVINALKHAFPDGRHGTITVIYAADAETGGWHLSVVDDGIGMPTGAAIGKAGLGTSIVEALTRQLGASVSVKDAAPGTAVTLVHKTVSATNDNPPLPDVQAL